MAHRQKPATAAWIAHERKRLGLSTAELRARLAVIGVDVSEQTIRVWEGYNNRPPGADRLDALERIFGSQAPEKAPAPEGEGWALMAAAIDRQTDVMRELVSLLRGQQQGAQEVRERVAALEGYAKEHEVRLQADRQLMGLAQREDPQSPSEPTAVGR